MSITRRGFLAGALGALSLTGCELQPTSKFWGLWTQAEGLWNSTLEAGPLKQALAKTYDYSHISKSFPIRSLTLADGYADTLSTWQLKVEGLIEKPRSFTMEELHVAFPKLLEVTRHDCVEGWSAIAQWGGVRLSNLIVAAVPKPEAKYIVFKSADFDDDKTPYYGSLTLEQALHPQTLLAYEMNGQPLPTDHGAPLRLKVPTQLGYKSTKFIHTIAFVDKLAGLGGGKGGYWEDTGYEYYAGL